MCSQWYKRVRALMTIENKLVYSFSLPAFCHSHRPKHRLPTNKLEFNWSLVSDYGYNRFERSRVVAFLGFWTSFIDLYPIPNFLFLKLFEPSIQSLSRFGKAYGRWENLRSVWFTKNNFWRNISRKHFLKNHFQRIKRTFNHFAKKGHLDVPTYDKCV